MRIVYLHQYFVTPEMSGGTRSYEMARRLVAAGHQVEMVTADSRNGASGGWRVTEEAGIRVHWIAVPYDNRMGRLGRILAFVRFAWSAAWRASRLPADVVFATSTPLTIAIPGMLAAALRRRPFVFEVRDQWPDVPIAIGAIRHPVAVGLARALERLTYRRAQHIVALAPGMREDIIAKGVPPEKVTVIPNGCDNGLFGLDAASESRVREAHAWLGERPLVIFTGTFGEVNGVEYLIRVAGEVGRIAPEVRFALFGAGRDVERVTRLATDLGLLDRTVFLHAPVPKSQLAEWLAAADISSRSSGDLRSSGRTPCRTSSSTRSPPDAPWRVTSMAGGPGSRRRRRSASGEEPGRWRPLPQLVDRLQDGVLVGSRAGSRPRGLGTVRSGQDDPTPKARAPRSRERLDPCDAKGHRP
ncbi:MAG: glycosyltransferase family 4 protein [Gemmatimonadetes bacterium]|nr:glycosyltransferase family 4 protein [Gemmatimonadota bacterium]